MICYPVAIKLFIVQHMGISHSLSLRHLLTGQLLL